MDGRCCLFAYHGVRWHYGSQSGTHRFRRAVSPRRKTVDNVLVASRSGDQIVELSPWIASPLVFCGRAGEQIPFTAARRSQPHRRSDGTPRLRLWRGHRSGSCPLRFLGVRTILSFPRRVGGDRCCGESASPP